MKNLVVGKNDVFRKLILSEISIGIYREGERLPSERELGERYNVSRNTIRRALLELENAGILFRRPPVGTFVAAGAMGKLSAREEESLPKVAFILNVDQLLNPEFQMIFHELQSRISGRAKLHVYFSDACDQLFQAQDKVEIAMLFGNYSDNAIRRMSEVVPHVVIWGRERENENFICCDNYIGGKLMAEAAYRAGHRHVAIYGPHGVESCDFSRRATGIMERCRELGMTFQSHWVTLEESMNVTPSTFFALEYFFRNDPQLTMILALSDCYALAVIDCCHRRGLNVPQDMSVIGFDDQCYAQFLEPPLTTVRNVATETGARLAAYVETVLETPNAKPMLQELLTPILIERDSVSDLKSVSE